MLHIHNLQKVDQKVLLILKEKLSKLQIWIKLDYIESLYKILDIFYKCYFYI